MSSTYRWRDASAGSGCCRVVAVDAQHVAHAGGVGVALDAAVEDAPFARRFDAQALRVEAALAHAQALRRITPLAHSTVCGSTSRKIRVGAPYRLSGRRLPAEHQRLLCRRHQAQGRRVAGLQFHVEVLCQHCRQCRVSLHQDGARRPSSWLPAGLPSAGSAGSGASCRSCVAAALMTRARREAQHEGLSGQHQAVDRLARNFGGGLQRPGAGLQRCAPPPGRRRGGAWAARRLRASGQQAQSEGSRTARAGRRAGRRRTWRLRSGV